MSDFNIHAAKTDQLFANNILEKAPMVVRNERTACKFAPACMWKSHLRGLFFFYLLCSMENENCLIELARVDGNMVPFERHGDNVWVNLTEMGRPFGQKKDPAHWLRAKGAREYIQAMRKCNDNLSAIQKCITDRMTDLIITRRGGIPGEQGTWCTDYRIAIEYGRWLSAEFSILFDSLLMRIARGERVLGDDGILHLNGRRWIGEVVYCKLTGRTRNSFNGYYGNYPLAFVLYEGVRYMDLEFFHNREQKNRIEVFRRQFRVPKDDPMQRRLEFKDE